MPTIQITDTTGVTIDSISANPNPITSALEKYVKSPFVSIVVLPDLVKALKQPLLTARQTPVSFGFNFSHQLDFSTSASPELTISAGVNQSVNVNSIPGSNLLPVGLFGSPIVVVAGQPWLSIAFSGNVNLGVNAAVSDLTFGVSAGGSLTTEYFRPFDATADHPTVAEAYGQVLSSFIIPADTDDLKNMKNGDLCAISCDGSLTLSADFSVGVSANPLASPNLPVINKAVTLQTGASLDVGASFELDGAYQIRVHKTGPTTVELGYYRKKGTQWTVSVKAEAGVEAQFGDTAFLAKLIGALTGKPAADLVQLINGGLTDDEIEQIQDAIADSIDHSLKASLDLEFSDLHTDEAAFSYRIDLSALNDGTRRAVNAALDGNLSSLTALEKNDDGHGAIGGGITRLRSALKNVRDKKVDLKVNLLGLLNFSSVFELIQQGEVVFEPLTGELTINETVSGTSIKVLTLPAAQQKLRSIRFNSLLITTAYRASRALGTMQVTSSDVFFAFNQNTNVQTLSDYLDSLIGVSLMSAGEKDAVVSGFHTTGASTFLLRVEFGDAACEAMFLKDGDARDRADFVDIGRKALINLLLPASNATDNGKFRRDFLANDAKWAKLQNLGPNNLVQVDPNIAHDFAKANLVTGDFITVEWWAESMASTAQQLVKLRTFIGNTDPATLEGNNTFNSLRNDLQHHISGVVKNSKLRFDQPFGLVALCQAAGAQAAPTGILVSDTLTRLFAPAVVARGV